MVIKMVIKNLPNLSRSKKRTWFALALGAFTCAQLAVFVSGRRIPAAYAQSYTDDDVSNYAQAVIAIEAKRKVAFEEASNIMASADSELDILETPLSCTSNRMADMPDITRASKIELRTVLVTFCNEASTLAEDNGLTPQRFNKITQAHRDDSELAERIKAAM
ncbi:MAG: DUF4168 domain-containing protein [Cyanobacteria bacterium J06621_3]